MPNKKAKPYLTKFKESAVKLAIESTNPIAQTARELGINVNIFTTNYSIKLLIPTLSANILVSQNCYQYESIILNNI